MANPDIIISPGNGSIGFSGSLAGDSNSSKLLVGSNGDLHMRGSDMFISGNLTVSGDITSSSASHQATSYTASTHVSGLSGYFGKVGIGSSSIDALTDSTVTRLQISHPDESFAVNLRAIGTSYIPSLALSSDRPSSNQEMGKIKWLNNGATPVAQIKAIRGSSDTVGHLNFQTCNAHAMQIWSDQKVQIASTQHVAPQATLVVSGDASITGQLRTNSTAIIAGDLMVGNTVVNVATNYATQIGLGFDASEGELEIAAGSSQGPLALGRTTAAGMGVMGDLRQGSNTFGTIKGVSTGGSHGDLEIDATGRLLLQQNGGNVGIGTINPEAELHVFNGTAKFEGADGNDFSLELGRSDNANTWKFNHAGADLRIYNSAGAGSDILLGVDAGGGVIANKVGIAVATPSGKLHVRHNDFTLFENNVAGANLTHKMASHNQIWQIAVRESDKASAYVIRDETAGVDAFAIKKGGNVGIGTTNAARKFMVHGGSARMGIKNSTEGVVLGLLSDDAGYFQLNSADGTTQIQLRAVAGD